MKSIAVLVVLLVSSAAMALGPVENGTYVGESVCWGKEVKRFKAPGEIIFTDTTMLWKSKDGSQHLKKFVIDKHGFFAINPKKENGKGYFTANGLHFEIVINGVEGEDTFFVKGKKLYLISSAVVNGSKVVCEGVFTRVEQKDPDD